MSMLKQADFAKASSRRVAVAIADHSGTLRSYGNIPAYTHALGKLHRRLAEDGSQIRYVYEAGPTGFALCRHLRSRKIVCEVVSPSCFEFRGQLSLF